MSQYNSAPIPTNGMPNGIPYIIGNELAERFSYYGMKTILVIFMTKYLANQTSALDVMQREEALTWYHLFSRRSHGFHNVPGIFLFTGTKNNKIDHYELFFPFNYFGKFNNSRSEYFYSEP